MNWSEALGSGIEVAIAIAGFSGIIAAVGRRGSGDWTPTDQLRLRVVLTASGVAGAFAVLPFIFLDAGLDAELFWRLGTGAQAAWLIAIPLHRRRQAIQMGLEFPADFSVNARSILWSTYPCWASLRSTRLCWGSLGRMSSGSSFSSS